MSDAAATSMQSDLAADGRLRLDDVFESGFRGRPTETIADAAQKERVNGHLCASFYVRVFEMKDKIAAPTPRPLERPAFTAVNTEREMLASKLQFPSHIRFGRVPMVDAIQDLSLTTVLVALNGWLAILAKNRYVRWVERRKFRHFRIMIIGRVIHELDNIWELVLNGDDHSPVVRTSDLVVTALVDAGFVSSEVPRVFTQACQDTRGRFGGLIGKLSQQFFDSRFIKAVEIFFEPDIRFGSGDGANDAESK